MSFFKTVFLLVFILAGIIVALYCWLWKPPKPILNVSVFTDIYNLPADKKVINTNEPIVFESGTKCVFGCPCINDTCDSKITLLESKWKEFNPDVVLVNIKKYFFIPGMVTPVDKFGMAGELYELAKNKKEEVYSYDLPDDTLINKLIKKYPAAEVAVTFLYNACHDDLLTFNKTDREDHIRHFLVSHRTFRLEGKTNAVKEIEDAIEKDFGKQDKQHDNLKNMPNYINDLSLEIYRLRFRHLLSILDHFNKAGKKVFLLCDLETAAHLQTEIK